MNAVVKNLTKQIGSRLLVARRAAGVQKTVLAAKLGVSRETISRWERGDHAIPAVMLVLIAKELRVGPDLLLGSSA